MSEEFFVLAMGAVTGTVKTARLPTQRMQTSEEESDGPVSVDLEIADGRTTITVSGQREASVIVRSASGERIYLPPERAPDTDESSPYRPTSSSKSPYEGAAGDSPYDGAQPSATIDELTPTATGFRIVHPEPVTDFRFLR